MSPAASPSPRSSPGPGNGRRHREEDEVDLDSPPAKKGRTINANTSRGGTFGIMGDACTDFASILDKGTELCNVAPDAREALPARDQALLRLFEYLRSTFYPSIVSDIVSFSSTTVADRLTKGRRDTFSSLIFATRRDVSRWWKLDPPLPDDISRRGFYCTSSARLLCPTDYDRDDPAVLEGLRNSDAKYKYGPTQFFYFMYADEKEDPDHPNVGFCRHPIMKAALVQFLVAPGAAVLDSGNQRRKAGTAKPHGAQFRLKFITIAAIAWAAVAVHYGLYNQDGFSMSGGTRKWPYLTFYRNVVRRIEKHMSEQDRTELLQWYSSEILGGYEFDEADEDDGPIDGEEPVGMARIRAALAAEAQSEL